MPGAIWLILLLAGAGVGLVIQNLLMTRIGAHSPGLVGALFVNSAVGVCLLAAVGVQQHGARFAGDLAAHFEPWFLAPGLLGTFFVLASVLGYGRLGAGATVATLVAAQLLAGLILDTTGLLGRARVLGPSEGAGALLLILGAVLILRDAGR